MKQLTMLIIILALMGCATQSSHINRPPTLADDGRTGLEMPVPHNPPVELPAWFVSPPADNFYSLGIARASADETAMRRAAQEYAAVCRARNISSYNVNKFIMVLRDNDIDSTEDTARFAVLVTSQTDLRQQCDRLRLVAEHRFDGYYLALFAHGRTGAGDFGEAQRFPPTVSPEWYEGDLVFPLDGAIVSTHRAGTADLVNAVDLAVAGARVQLSRYRKLDVHGEVSFQTVEGDATGERSIGRKAVSMETVVEMGEVFIYRLHVNRKSTDGLYSYEVFAQLRMQ
ncbi:MAG: hypothetical protein K8R90_10115 [Candidatus Cloacimonetes bacterium]|nr:hypothetical protein [Candidatus Cloacimonadota bacterium]